MPVPLRSDVNADALRAIARQTKDGPQARRLLALAAIYDGATRTEAARIGGVTVQIVRDWVVKFNAHGPEGLVNRKPPGQPQAAWSAVQAHRHPSGGPAGHRRARAHSGHPRRGALASRRPDPVGLGGVPPLDRQADLEPGAAGHELSQALGPSAPSRQERGRGFRF